MAKGGARKGAGRKKGSLSKTTLDRLAVLEHLRSRTMKSADLLWNAQMTLARGQTFLYRIDKEWIKTGKTSKGGEEQGYWKNKKPVLVTDEDEIKDYLEGEFADGDAEDDKDEGVAYYYMTSKEPNGQAIDSMLDRSLGKAVQPLSGPGGDGSAIPVTITGMKIVKA